MASSPKAPADPIDARLVRKLADILTETGLTEIEVADGDKRIRVTKAVTVQSFTAPQAAPAAAAANAAPAPVAQVKAISPENHPGAVKSPMVGTAYLQSEPGAPKFASVGQTVKPGDTLLIIEAMKVMNPIKAEKGGTVTDILIDDAQPVEFGQPLMVIE